jgi:hypothetical protein
MKELWEKKPVRYGVYVAAAIAVLIVVAQLNDWLRPFG